MDDKEFGVLFKAMSRFTYLANNKFALPNLSNIEDEMLEKINLTQEQLLMKIYNGGPIQIARIADIFSIKRPNATRLANSMVKLGCCEKVYKNNNRHVYLAASARGSALVEKIKAAMQQSTKDLLDKYATQKEQKKMLEFYTYMNSILERFP